MTVTIHKIDGAWLFDENATKPLPACVTRLVRVPDGSAIVPVELTKEKLTRFVLMMPGNAASGEIYCSADKLAAIAETRGWIVSTIV